MDFWKRKDEPPLPPKEEIQPIVNPVNPVKEATPVSTSPQERKLEVAMQDSTPSTVAHIGKSVTIKGEVSGNEDIYIDGQVEGMIEVREHNLTIGPNGRVQANVNAKQVVLHGSLKGNVKASDRVDIRKSGSLVGDVVAARVMIEDGASIKGSVDIQKTPEPAGRPLDMKRADVAPPPMAEAHPKYSGSPVEAKKLN